MDRLEPVEALKSGDEESSQKMIQGVLLWSLRMTLAKFPFSLSWLVPEFIPIPEATTAQNDTQNVQSPTLLVVALNINTS